VVVSPDYSEASKFADLWLHPKQGTDAALAMALGHVILKEFHVERQSPYFTEYVRENTDLPFLVMLKQQDGFYVQDRFFRASDFSGALGQANNPDWKTVAYDEVGGQIVPPDGAIGFRWGESGRWNIEQRAAGAEIKLRLSLIDIKDTVVSVGFPYFGGSKHPHFTHSPHDPIQQRKVPVKKITLADGTEVFAATVFDLLVANYGIDRGLGGANVAASYDAIC
jgi:nitrate reductase alpha subunit